MASASIEAFNILRNKVEELEAELRATKSLLNQVVAKLNAQDGLSTNVTDPLIYPTL